MPEITYRTTPAAASCAAVLRAIGADDEIRRHALDAFKATGGNMDRWSRRDREAMADALTAAEDALEGSRRAALVNLRAARRRLELELWA
jgi:hypothetical protein